MGTGIGIGVSPAFSSYAAAVAASAWEELLDSLQDETDGMVLYFTDPDYPRALIRDTTTPANSKDVDANSVLTYTSPALKNVLHSDGLLKYAAHNRFLQSENVSNASWGKTSASASGTDLVTQAAGAGLSPQISQAVSVAVGEMIKIKFDVKANGQQWFFVNTTGAASVTNDICWFDALNGVAGTEQANVSTTMTAAGDGWYSCEVQYLAGMSATGSCTMAFVMCSADGSTATITGDGTSGLYFRKFHFFAYPADETYIQTTTAARYRLPVEYDTAGDPVGLLVEEARTNSFTYSEDFSNAAWTKTNLTVSANAVTAPDGTTTADRLVESSATGEHGVYQLLASRTTDTFTCYVKAGERTFAALRAYNANNNWVTHVFNLSTGAVTQTSAGSSSGYSAVSSSSTDAGNGWWRLTLTSTRASGSTYYAVDLATSGTPTLQALPGTQSYAGNTSNGIYVWGAQLEAGSFPTSYIRTTSATVTRAADNISLATSAMPYSATATTLIASVKGPPGVAAAGFNLATQLDDGSTNNRILLYRDASGNPLAWVVNGGALNVNLDLGTFTASADAKVAIALASNDAAASFNGGTVGTDATVSTVTATQLRIGCGIGGGGELNGHIKYIKYLPRRVANADLQTESAA